VSQHTTNRAFDDLARALAEGSISRRRALKLFAGSAIAALIPSRALARQQKETICHKPGTPEEKTIEVSQSAVASHLGHGDTLGACGTTTTTTTAAPTTTSTTSTTSTSTSTSSTTSTSTSTTSTSTTPMCQPNGGTCSTGGTPCCSGNCSNGFCCPSGYFALSNGTCVRTCLAEIGCPGCSAGCVIIFHNAGICSNAGGSNAPCPGGDIDCPRGEFCGPLTNRVCTAAC
jgi:hypothetical protein